MSNLVNHAREELVRIGEEPETIAQVLDVIQAFADMGHSGHSASHFTHIINKLLQFKPLSPLTADPSEWTDISVMSGQDTPFWQSTRDPECFSTDGGVTYYSLSERDLDPTSFHTSLVVPEKDLPNG